MYVESYVLLEKIPQEVFTELQLKRKQMPEMNLYNRHQGMIIMFFVPQQMQLFDMCGSMRPNTFLKHVFCYFKEPTVLLERVVPGETLAHFQRKPMHFASCSKDVGNRGMMLFYFAQLTLDTLMTLLAY